MDINGWLTVITIIAAIFALMPNDEQPILLNKITCCERILFIITFIVAIPFLVKFDEISDYWPVFKNFTVTNGYNPDFISLFIFWIWVVWILIKFSFFKVSGKLTKKIIQHYRNLLFRNFEEFFSIFTKYNSPQRIKKQWEFFKPIFSEPLFLQSITLNRSYYLVQFLDKFEEERDFHYVMNLFLEDTNSVLYQELKANPTAFSIQGSPLLNLIIKQRLQISIDLGLLGLIEDHAKRLIDREPKDSKYNKAFVHQVEQLDGHDLPIYFQIKLIGLLFDIAIKEKMNLNHIRHSLFCIIVKKIIEKIHNDDVDLDREYPSNYFWLLSEIFQMHDNWITALSETEIDEDGEEVEDVSEDVEEFARYWTLSVYANASYYSCLDALVDGFDEGKIPQRFIDSIGYYHFFNIYLSHNAKENFLQFMEEHVINDIQIPQLVSILDKTFDEAEAFSCYNFCNKGGYNKPRIRRLFHYLDGKGKIALMIDSMKPGGN